MPRSMQSSTYLFALEYAEQAAAWLRGLAAGRYGESLVERTPEERLQRFIYAGDDRNIEKRIVRGEDIPCPFADEERAQS